MATKHSPHLTFDEIKVRRVYAYKLAKNSGEARVVEKVIKPNGQRFIVMHDKKRNVPVEARPTQVFARPKE